MPTAKRLAWVYEATVTGTPDTSYEHVFRGRENQNQYLSSESSDCGYWVTFQVDQHGRGEIVGDGTRDFTRAIFDRLELCEV